MRHGLVVGVFGLVIIGCGAKEPTFLRPEARAAAKVRVAAPECPGRPKIVASPEHCLFDPGPESRVMRVDVDLTAEVDENGKARGVKLAGPSAGEEADRAAINCALHGQYVAGPNGAGETCPFRLRLARYAVDVAPRATLTCGPTEASFMANGMTARPCPGP